MPNITTLLAADILISGRKLRELLGGLTANQFTDWVEQHAHVLIPGTPYSQAETLAAVQAAGVTDTGQIKRIAADYLSDAVQSDPQYDTDALERDFKQNIEEYVTQWEETKEEVEAAIQNLTREQCTKILTDISIQVDDNETLEELREDIQAKYDDGTLNTNSILQSLSH